MNRTKIEWATTVWNPVTGCTKISEGCKNCYAEGIAKRFWGERKFTDVQCYPERLSQPEKWKKGQRIFVNSMSDLFHPDVPYDFIVDVFAVMNANRQHTFIVLTKRPDRYYQFMSGAVKPIPNVWIGVSVENQKAADERIPILLQAQAAVRFVSCEPLLGNVNLKGFYKNGMWVDGQNRIDWVIVGGESGTRARPMHPNWVRSIRDQCQEANVPFFFKQWGEWQLTNEREEMKQDGNERLTSIDVPGAIGYQKAWFRRVGKNRAGRELDGRTWDEYPKEVRDE